MRIFLLCILLVHSVSWAQGTFLEPKKKWEFGTSFETWNLFNYRYTGKLDKACVAFDVEYKLSKRNAFKFAYQNQFDIQQADKTSLNMYILGYEYTFKKLWKKKR